MSYQRVKTALDDLSKQTTPQKDPVLWNLAQAIRALAEAVESDMNQIKKQMSNIESDVISLR